MGEPVAVSVLVELLGNLARFFSVGKTVDSLQLIETAKLILQEFYFLKIADLKLFFDRLKTGYYGAMFDRLDGNVIMVHLRTYCNERSSTAETLSLEKHKQQMALDATEEKYIVATGPNYVAHNHTEGYFETEHQDLATLFTYDEALRIKTWLVKEHFPHAPDNVKIKRPSTQPGLMAYLQQHRPDLVPFDIARMQRVTATVGQMRAIDEDASLSAFEKYNAKAVLCGFEAVSEEEFLREERLRNKM